MEIAITDDDNSNTDPTDLLDRRAYLLAEIRAAEESRQENKLNGLKVSLLSVCRDLIHDKTPTSLTQAAQFIAVINTVVASGMVGFLRPGITFGQYLDALSLRMALEGRRQTGEPSPLKAQMDRVRALADIGQ